MGRDRLAEALVGRAMDLHARRLWREVEIDEVVAVEVPGEAHPVVAMILGQAGEQYGMTVFTGDCAVADAASMIAARERDEDLLERIDQLGFTVDPLGAIPGSCRAILEAAGLRGRRETLAPWFFAKQPGRRTRTPGRAQQKLLLSVINAVLGAAERGDLQPVALERGTILTLRVEGTASEPAVSARFAPARLSEAESASATHVSTLRLVGLEHTAARWVVGIGTLPVAVRGDDRMVRAAVVCDRDTEEVVTVAPFMGNDLVDAAQRVLDAMGGENRSGRSGLPRSILATSRPLAEILAEALDAHGVAVEHGPRDELLDDLIKDLSTHVVSQVEDGSEDDEDLGSSDVGRFRAIDDEVTHALVKELKRLRRDPDAHRGRYFGGNEPPGLERFGDLPLVCFYEWLIFLHRPTRRAVTVAESVLARRAAITGAARELLEARRASRAAFYRVADVAAGVGLTLEDVFTGETVDVRDVALSRSLGAGDVVPLRVYPAGPYHFLAPCGPVLRPADLLRATDFLETQGLEVPDGLAEHADRLGRLWRWVAARADAPRVPSLANADGDPLQWLTLTYALADPAATRTALTEREDVDADAAEDLMRWLKPAPKGWAGEHVSAATLQLIGDELLVEVNSEARMRAVRAWLDALPGVAFRGAKERSLTEASADAALPTLGQAPPSDEMMAALREMMMEHQRKWLDEPIPALGGKTPREACRTTKGQSRVAQMIRTMPPAFGPGGVTLDIPRDWMLKELGIG